MITTFQGGICRHQVTTIPSPCPLPDPHWLSSILQPWPSLATFYCLKIRRSAPSYSKTHFPQLPPVQAPPSSFLLSTILQGTVCIHCQHLPPCIHSYPPVIGFLLLPPCWKYREQRKQKKKGRNLLTFLPAQQRWTSKPVTLHKVSSLGFPDFTLF